MTVGELRKFLEPFMDEAVLLVKQDGWFFPVVKSSYVHMAEGHPYIEIPKEAPLDESW
jgi:hypothetical protein